MTSTRPSRPSFDGTRRSFLAATGVAGAAAFLAACGGDDGGATSTRTGGAAASGGTGLVKGGELNVYSWPDYFAKENLAAYRKATGTKLNVTTYADNDTLFAKLNAAGGSGYDLVIPSSGYVQQLAGRGKLEKLDHARLPLDTLDPSLLDKEYDPGNAYSVPKDWGVLGVVYDPAAVGGRIATWQDVLDAGAKPGVSGKVRLGSSGYQTVGVALWAGGGRVNTTDEAEIRRAGDTMKGFVRHVKTFDAFDADAVAKGTIVLSTCNQSQARNAILQNPKLEFVIPGPRSELWVDCYAIPAGAPNQAQAYSFLNFLLQPKRQVTDTEFIGYPAALKGLEQRLPRSTKERDLIFGGKDADLDALETYVVNPKTAQLYSDLQSELQAAAA
ncbi:spermidine/putrescine ABC transporter substrate-binding protein [Patulibacter sp. SYSU D01012]|uniref:polyamine ABC transporter substrate-binding protein n=1 Tax=Patulibacter sp. SYSU D01012 TaxID=2817381 RepID=UPI001B30D855|nr:spermidine/putrescine ABC transporter substrate-binding protein [Patulibacter sp. SYSU D01012]